MVAADCVLRTDDGEEWVLDNGRHSVGRGEECEVLTPPSDTRVSRRHAWLDVDGSAAWVEDSGSANGTWVNDRRIQHRVSLVDGDVLRVGDTRLHLLRSAADVAPTHGLSREHSVPGEALRDHELSGLAARGDPEDTTAGRPSEHRARLLAGAALGCGRLAACAAAAMLFFPWLEVFGIDRSYVSLLEGGVIGAVLVARFGNLGLLVPLIAALLGMCGRVPAPTYRGRARAFACFLAGGLLGLTSTAVVHSQLAGRRLLWIDLDTLLGAGFYGFGAAATALVAAGGMGCSALAWERWVRSRR